MTPLDNFYQQKEEPLRGCLLALRQIILAYDKNIDATWKYNMPFFTYHGKMFCYLWINKKTQQPYIGMVEGKLLNHPNLIQEKRSRMKIIPLDANADLPVVKIKTILRQALNVYKSGTVKIKGH